MGWGTQPFSRRPTLESTFNDDSDQIIEGSIPRGDDVKNPDAAQGEKRIPFPNPTIRRTGLIGEGFASGDIERF